ncbi:thioredoxin family protein [uncultured Shewanella sp.]|uniref:TlpA family protein disulfide reductase n=1 Tax=uncultured Shewanella sp. TaxID=173975 RepID=UPI002636A386|nr:thioredoxin family protein [uncultured Shewanella sp.]
MNNTRPNTLSLCVALLTSLLCIMSQSAYSSTLATHSTESRSATSANTDPNVDHLVNTLPWLAYQHEHLVTHQQEHFQDFEGKPSLFMFFEPECPWCAKQGKAFNQLLAQCPNAINIAALASHGNKTVLRKAAWKMKLHFPAYLASQTMMLSIGPLPATPITLIIDEKGQLHSVLRGYVKLAQLLPKLKQEFGLKCG